MEELTSPLYLIQKVVIPYLKISKERFFTNLGALLYLAVHHLFGSGRSVLAKVRDLSMSSEIPHTFLCLKIKTDLNFFINTKGASFIYIEYKGNYFGYC